MKVLEWVTFYHQERLRDQLARLNSNPSDRPGTRHIGAIKAVSASVMVFGSAVGPGFWGL
jgi:hypothetical protein